MQETCCQGHVVLTTVFISVMLINAPATIAGLAAYLDFWLAKLEL